MADKFLTTRGYADTLTGALVQIDSDHAYIHQGRAFSAVGAVTISGATYIGFKTPTVASGLFMHWRPIAITTTAGDVIVELTEGDSYTGGASVTPINRNRNSNNTTAIQDLKFGVTSTPTGTVLQALTVSDSYAVDPEAELLLKPNTDYVFSLTPAESTTVGINLFWYEEEGTG